MSRMGLHLRVEQSLLAIAHQAINLELPYFQSFLMGHTPDSGVIVPSDRDVMQFRKLCEKRFPYLYAHAPFWLNLADPARSSLDGLWQQVVLAQRLGFTHLTVHPGSSVRATKQQGIEMVARTLNGLFKKESTVTILLENTAHGKKAVGSDITDLRMIRDLLDKPEKLQFCIDTAHAHVYGYTVNSINSMHTFLQYVQSELGDNSIGLLHLNDASDLHGSFKDRHALIGTGTIGEFALKTAFYHDTLTHVPVIVEPPVLSDAEMAVMYNTIRCW